MPRSFRAPLTGLPYLDHMIGDLRTGASPVSVSGCADSQEVHLAAELTEPSRSVLFLTYNEVRAREILDDAQTFFAQPALLYPARDLLFFHSDVRGMFLTRQRMTALKQLLSGAPLVLVTTIDALLDRLPDPAVLRKNSITLRPGDEADMTALAARLTQLGYEHTAEVTMPGEYCLRGGILDVYPAAEESPLRIEFWGDEIDSLRSFDPETQRSIENLDSAEIFTASEGRIRQFALDSLEIAAPAIDKIREDCRKAMPKVAKERYERAFEAFTAHFANMGVEDTTQ